jgi:hypothetical protein
VGLNLFVASALYEKGLGHIIKSVAPFVGLMLIGLAIITWFPQVSIGLGNAIMGGDPDVMLDEEGEVVEGGMPTMEEMMREAMGDDEGGDDEELEDEDLEGEELEDDEAQEPDTTE